MVYLEKKYSKDHGMVKVIPPPNWQAGKNIKRGQLDSNIIKGPIEQNVQGKQGIYELLLIQKNSLTFKAFEQKSEYFENITVNKKIEEVEELFWKNIAFSPPLYGADLNQTLFDETAKQWNLSKLPSVLACGLKQVIPGVNEPFVYVGAWKTMFAWHKEDLDLSAINFHHYGKTKFWYALKKSDDHYLQDFAKEQFQQSASKCNQFLRHKTSIIQPHILKNKFPNITIEKTNQKPGEFVIVFSGAYHTGFNWGFNVAEAVNFATPSWLNKFLDVQRCECQSQTVQIEPKTFLEKLLRSEFKNCPEVIAFKKKLELKNSKQKISDDQETTQDEENAELSVEQMEEDDFQEEDEESLCDKKIKQSKKSKQIKKKQQPKQKSQQIQNSKSTRSTRSKVEEIKHNTTSNSNSPLQEPEIPIKAQASIKQPTKVTKKIISKQKNINKIQIKNEDKTESIKERTRERLNYLQLKKQEKNKPLQQDVLNWIQCDSCNQWRTIPLGKEKIQDQKTFLCNLLNFKCNKN